MGALTGVTSGADQAFVAFFGALVAQGVVDNDANKAKVFELIIMLREGAKDSRKRALAAAGVGGVGLVAPTRAAFLAAANQVCTNLRIGAQPTLLLAEKHCGKGNGGNESFTCGDFNARWGCEPGACRYDHVCRACGSRAHGEWACSAGRGDRTQRGGDGGRKRSRDRGNGR